MPSSVHETHPGWPGRYHARRVRAASAATAQIFTFACAGGRSFAVTYDEGLTVATVTMDDAIYKLPAAISASGARYSDGKVEFWEHQGEAMLSGFVSAPATPCPQKRAE